MTERREPPLRPLDLLRVLREHEVDFVVIGGFSLAIHGYIRGTQDVDIVPALGPENRERLWRALEDLKAEPMAIGDLQAGSGETRIQLYFEYDSTGRRQRAGRHTEGPARRTGPAARR